MTNCYVLAVHNTGLKAKHTRVFTRVRMRSRKKISLRKLIVTGFHCGVNYVFTAVMCFSKLIGNYILITNQHCKISHVGESSRKMHIKSDAGWNLFVWKLQDPFQLLEEHSFVR
jgi:hypothetical protein